MPYVKNVTVNGESFDAPIITHEQIASGGEIIFEMAAEPQEWASATLAGKGNTANQHLDTTQHDEL